MEENSYISIIFITCTIISLTIYAIYTGFGPYSNKLKDPFQEHED